MNEMIDSRVASGENAGDLLSNLVSSSLIEGGKKLRLDAKELMGSKSAKLDIRLLWHNICLFRYLYFSCRWSRSTPK